MKTFIFKNKSSYYWPLYMVNLLIPIAIYLQSGKGIASVSKSWIIGFVFVAMAIISSIVYAYKTLKEIQLTRHVFVNFSQYQSRFSIGMWLHALVLNLLLGITVINIFYSTSTWLPWVMIACAVVTLILGITSNIFLNIFEFRFNFSLYYAKYKDSVVADVISSIEERNTRLSSS